MINALVRASLRLRGLVFVAAVLVMTVGIVRLDNMPVDVFPEILPPTVHVHTEALGLSAEEVEQLITVPIEADLLAGTPWVETMRSSSVPGLSSIELTFKRGTDPMHARQVVQERLTQAHALPQVSKPPAMLQPLSSTNRIMLIGLSSKTQSLIEMSVLARWTIRPRLMGVPGVANVSIWGQRERQLQVQVDPQRLREKNVALIDVIKTAGNALWYSPLSFVEAAVAGTGGFIETPNQRLGVRHVLPISVAADLAKVPVEGTNIPLDQVATVVEDHQPLIGDGMGADGSSLMLLIEKLPGVNTLEVSDEILEALAALKPGLGGIEFDPNVYHPANYIRGSIGNVANALLIGLILLVVGLLALSYNWRAALIGLVSISVAVIGALLVFGMTDATMNVMVLAGLVVALAVVVDDAIAFSDHLARRLRERSGGSALATIFQASAELRHPLMFATSVVIVAALPALLMAGATGALVSPMIYAYGLAVLASLVVAATVTPALTMLFFQNAGFARQESALEGWLRGRYERVSPAAGRVGVVVVVLAAVAGLALLPALRVSPAPSFKEPDVLVNWDAAPGTSRPEMNRMLDRVSRELRAIPGVRNVGAHVGRAVLADQVVGIHSSEMWVNLSPDADYEATVAAIERAVDTYPGIDGDVTTFLRSRFEQPLRQLEEPIVVRVYGQEGDILRQEAEKLKVSLAGIRGISDPQIEEASVEPVVEIKVDLEAARHHGIKPGDVRRAAATLVSGLEVGNLFEEQKIFEVVVWGVPRIRHSIEAVRDLQIETPRGGYVRLGDVASLNFVATPTAIQRENVARTIDVVAAVSGASEEAVATAVRNHLQQASFPLEYRAELVGDFAVQEQARRRMLLGAVGAALGILFILQAAFRSWGLALVMLVTLPLALAGGSVAAALGGGALSLASAAGFLGVLAVTVRQGVALIGRYRDLRVHDGMAFGPDLITRGTRERAAPILTAAILTGLAVLPFALFAGRAGHEALGPLALVMLGGLVTSTLYTLFVVPALYSRFGAGAMPEPVDLDHLETA